LFPHLAERLRVQTDGRGPHTSSSDWKNTMSQRRVTMAPQKNERLRRFLGYSVYTCPICNQELMNMGYDEIDERYTKECPECDLLFTRRKKGRWKMIPMWEVEI